MTELSYPSVLLDPKTGNYGRIARGGETPKSPSIPHVVERAVRNGERQPRQRRGKGESAASGQLPLFARSRRRRRSGSTPARTRRQSRNTPTPLAGPRSSGRGGSLSRHNTRCSLRPPPLPPPPPPASPAHLKGGKKKKKSQDAKLPKEKTRGEKSAAQGEQSLKGEKASYDLCKHTSLQIVPTVPLTNQHKCHKSFPWCKSFPYT